MRGRNLSARDRAEGTRAARWRAGTPHAGVVGIVRRCARLLFAAGGAARRCTLLVRLLMLKDGAPLSAHHRATPSARAWKPAQAAT